MSSETISILGCGWLGKAFGGEMHSHGWSVKGSTTREENFSSLSGAGIIPFRLNLTSGWLEQYPADFFASRIVVIAVPPGRKSGNPDDYVVRMKEVSDLIEQQGVGYVILISSTSVYGDGQNLDEDDALPENYLRKTELVFLSSRLFQTTVVRFGGLTGPGRHAGRFLSGKQVTGGGNPVNIIHQQDCVGILKAIIKQGKWGRVYNGCSPLHPVRQAFYSKMALSAGLPLPEFISPDVTSLKTVSVDRVKNDLGYEFVFPDPMAFTF